MVQADVMKFRLPNVKNLLRYLRALPTIRVHPELDGRALGIVHSFTDEDLNSKDSEDRCKRQLPTTVTPERSETKKVLIEADGKRNQKKYWKG